MFLDYKNQNSFSDKIIKNNNDNNDNLDDDEIESVIDMLTKKSKKMIF